MKLMDRLPKAFRKAEPMTKERERELLVIVQLGEQAERLVLLPEFMNIFHPISQEYRRRKLNQTYSETDQAKKLQLLGNAQAIDELGTEITNVIQAGKRAALELQTKRTKP